MSSIFFSSIRWGIAAPFLNVFALRLVRSRKKGRTKKGTERYEWKEEKEHRKVRATRSNALFQPSRKRKERNGKKRKERYKFGNCRLPPPLSNLPPLGKNSKVYWVEGSSHGNDKISPPRPLAISMDRGSQISRGASRERVNRGF